MKKITLNNLILSSIGIIFTVFLGFYLNLNYGLVIAVSTCLVYVSFSTKSNPSLEYKTYLRYFSAYLVIFSLSYLVQRYSEYLQEGTLQIATPITLSLMIIGIKKALHARIHKKPKSSIQKQSFHSRDDKVVAVHESGHALIHAFAKDCLDNDFSINILNNDDSYSGFVKSYVEDHEHLSAPFVKFYLLNLLAGTAAEDVVLGSHTSGSNDDLNKWMSIATKYGQSCLGLRLYNPPKDALEAEANLNVLSQLQEKQYLEVWKFLEINKEVLKELSLLVLEKRVLNHHEVMPFLEKARIPDGSKLITPNLLDFFDS